MSVLGMIGDTCGDRPSVQRRQGANQKEAQNLTHIRSRLENLRI